MQLLRYPRLEALPDLRQGDGLDLVRRPALVLIPRDRARSV